MIWQILLGIGLVIAVGTIASVFGAFLFEGVNWLRTYGFPQTARQSAFVATVGEGPLLGAIAVMVDSYNGWVLGFSRFGSGLGMIAACFWTLGPASKFARSARIVIGAFAGMCIGARLVMMVTSQPNLVLVGALIGSGCCAVYLALATRPSEFKPIPRLYLHNEP